MRKLWPPIYDKFTGRIWSLAVAVAVTVLLTLWLRFAPHPPVIVGYLSFPGVIGALAVSGFDSDNIGSNPWPFVVWPLANFVFYFTVARGFIGILKAIHDIRNA